MLAFYDLETARSTILKRRSLDDIVLPPAMLQSISRLFGESLTPAQAVARILDDVRNKGDMALRYWTTTLDGAAPDQWRVTDAEIKRALQMLLPDQRDALEQAAERVYAFHRRQPLTSWITQEMGGTIGQVFRPIRRVGLYIPGGTAPLPSSVLMTAIPAQVAGVREIVLVAPPQGGTGQIAPIILAAAGLLGISEIYALGGAQAIAALAYGTESIPAVDKLFGPGNLFVTLAKRQVFGVVGIDSLAGPTETLIIADDSARPDWVAADLLAQAEHDLLASAILLTPSHRLAESVQLEVAHQVEGLSRKEIIAASLQNNGGVVLTQNLDEAISVANTYGPEHLCLSVSDPWRWAEKVTTAGGIFLGEHSFEVLGDYVAGPSHVMPTGGSARYASALNVWDFMKVVSLIALDPATAARIAPTAATIAHAEGLDGHARAAEKRS